MRLMDRRTFLQSGALLPALGLPETPQVRAPAPARHSSFDPWVEIRADHLRANVAAVQNRAKVPILAVIKNNGYGAGVVNVAHVLEPLEAIQGFAVVKLQEAVTLREAGIRKSVLLMGPVAEADILEAAARDIALMVYTPIAPALERAAGKTGRPVTIHVCVDTGLGRVGVPHRQALPLMRDLAGARGIRIAGTMMTFSEDPELDREQIRRFERLHADLKRAGLDAGARHAASSFTLFQHPDAFFDMVRPGMALYGIYSELAFRTTGALDLTPAIALRARVAYVKQLQEGETAGYNRAYIARRPVWVATLPIGHGDGVPRAAAKGGRVRIGGALYPIVASVSASHTIVEIGPERRVEMGDEVTLFDWTAGSRPEDLSAACGASVYDLAMHLNPLLPRVLLDA
jgi:alanine racemase